MIAGQASATQVEYARFAAIVSVAAAVIHLAVGPAHLREYGLFGVLFLVTAALQAAWAWRVWNGGSTRLLVAGAGFNVAVVLVWVWSRTAGLPIGPTPWRPESISVVDAQATINELLIAALVAAALRPPQRGWWRRIAYGVEGLVLIALVASFLLAASGAGHAD